MAVTSTHVLRDLEEFLDRGLLTQKEAGQARDIVGAAFPFAEAVALAESVHVHVNVDDVSTLDSQTDLASLAQETSGTPVERKFVFASGLNVIFASEATAQDELVPGAVTQPRPYVDHFGVDLRDETEKTELVFTRIPQAAATAGWRYRGQDGPIRCCYTEMGPKHWVYPPENLSSAGRPIEFAFGDLTASAEHLGCDYRPMDPAHPLAGLGEQAAAAANQTPAVNPSKIYCFEERTCNTSPSRPLVEFLSQRYGAVGAEVRSFDVGKPEGLLPLPPALFMALEQRGFGVLPALVVDGQLKSTGSLPSLMDVVDLIENPGAVHTGANPGAVSEACCSTDGSCC